MDGITFVGLDVHVKTITMAVIRADGVAQEVGTLANTAAGLRKRLGKLGDPAQLTVCYEAGPCGYGIYRELTRQGIACQVIAPSLIPTKAGDRVKTDRRDAVKLARLLRSGDLTAIGVPTPELEALRDLSRARQAAVTDLHRLRQRLLKLFSHHGQSEPARLSRWERPWWSWATAVTLAQPASQIVLDDLRTTIVASQTRLDRLTTDLLTAASQSEPATLITALQSLHGVGPITAIGIVAEVGDLTRFAHPTQLVAYGGLNPSEHSSGSRQQRGGITKTGNRHVRYLIVEAAWHYAHPMRPATHPPATVIAQIAAHARERLAHRYRALTGKHKANQAAAVAVARELLCFMWAIAQEVARPPSLPNAEQIAA